MRFGLVTELGSTHVIVAGALIAVAGLVGCRRRSDAALVAVAVAGGEVLNAVLKAIVHRGRPEFADPISTAGGFSFPSGHAMMALISMARSPTLPRGGAGLCGWVRPASGWGSRSRRSSG